MGPRDTATCGVSCFSLTSSDEPLTLTWVSLDLMLLAVEPSYHRRGIGKMLLQHGLDLVVRDEKDAFLIATPGGRGLYQKMGFRQVGEEYTLGGTPHYSMLWQRPAAGSL